MTDSIIIVETPSTIDPVVAETVSIVVVGDTVGVHKEPAIEICFCFGDATPKPLCTLPAGKVIYSLEICITEPFDGDSSSLTIGDAEVSDRLMQAVENDPKEVGRYMSSPVFAYGAATQIVLSITPGVGSTRGRGIVRVEMKS